MNHIIIHIIFVFKNNNIRSVGRASGGVYSLKAIRRGYFYCIFSVTKKVVKSITLHRNVSTHQICNKDNNQRFMEDPELFWNLHLYAR